MIMTPEHATLRLIWAVLMGGVIGYDRERTHSFAGLRTHILVCLGSAAFTLLSITNLFLPPHPIGNGLMSSPDPGRIAAQILTGIGFIGGGAVLRSGVSVRGVTTASSLWIVAAIGMLAGAGQFRLSLITTIFSFVVLYTVGRLARKIWKNRQTDMSRLIAKLIVNRADQTAIQAWFENEFGGRILEVQERLMDSESKASEKEEKLVRARLNYIIDMEGLEIKSINGIHHKIQTLAGIHSTTLSVERTSD